MASNAPYPGVDGGPLLAGHERVVCAECARAERCASQVGRDFVSEEVCVLERLRVHRNLRDYQDLYVFSETQLARV